MCLVMAGSGVSAPPDVFARRRTEVESMPSARVRGTVLTGIAGLALGAMFGFAPAASADTGSSPAPLGLLGNTVGSTVGVVSSTLGGLTGGVTGGRTEALAPRDGQAPAHTDRSPTSTRHRGGAAHAAQHTDRSHRAGDHGRADHGRADHGRAQRHPAGHAHRQVTSAQRHKAPPAAERRSAKLAAFESSTTPQQNAGLLGGLLNGLTSLVNGTISGVTGLIGDATHGLGQLLGGGPPSSSPPSSPPASSPPGGGSGSPTGPGSSTPPSSSHQASGTPAGSQSGGAPSTSAHRTLARALPAPADVPSLISSPTRTVVPTTHPQPTPASSPIAEHVVPVSLTSAPSGWVLFAAVGLFAIAVVFMVLGAGYRGRRAR
jgi:hypothetical protein